MNTISMNTAEMNAIETLSLDRQENLKSKFLLWVFIVLLVYLILLAVGMIGSGFKWASGGQEGAEALFAFATNPFMGLVMGIIATALVQSSSTVTSVIVGLVAGGLPVASAIPMVMGANIGTTVTNTLVSLAHIRSKEEFQRAFSAATIHDFFNLFCVVIFLPLEIAFGFLEKVSMAMASFVLGGESLSMSGLNFIKPITNPIISACKDIFGYLPDPLGGIVLATLGVLLIFAAIAFLGKLLREVMVGQAKRILHGAISHGPMAGIASGTAVTMLVQSSSTTTSLIVPLAGVGLLNTREIYPFTLGANIGTCITSLLAATAISGGMAIFALQIALVHLIYNVLGVAVIYSIKFLRELPIMGAEALARVATERKYLAGVYVLSVFFLIPLILMGVTSHFGGTDLALSDMAISR
uniref:Solute carrier family 34 (Sodium-dependent phosphate cotransporter) n=1 Tax=Candidatus Kentrum sp. TUN TaxID=2126343 RepID=A0A450ZRN6_9GAMM|nr:MAG: solute carrier family 34 (sodium-dependent phosphate cotransporter) [Candidatus Kentron sp. TUN]VFK55095.1 MAG: solute carrier family 34 (sodium-dependent phosphate cotransporter) [Candidatus Kentron sp. TUN]VFK56420.1 MAG: solute carrier family 34 (sodium-dependent phosphate cotransporter) [Candidatus Kentron sp. TUN]